ncbi:thiamine pyrophosphate-dependent acetolactate synthase large subunit-like protein [Bradyrhizobium sp. I1.7.5]
MAGGGAHSKDAPAALARLQDLAALPVFTTNMGKGAVDERHPLSCGVLGALVGPASLGRHSRALLAEADLILQIGTRNNQNGTDNWRLVPPTARLVQIDNYSLDILLHRHRLSSVRNLDTPTEKHFKGRG